MAHGCVSAVIPAPSAAVFDLLHDYDRRLEWDTLLSAAYLADGHTAAGKGVTSVCVGRRSLGGLAFKTVYVTFERPSRAAVKLVNAPAFFATWAASIQHQDLPGGASRISYTFHFTARPRLLRPLLDPLMERIFRWETQKRLPREVTLIVISDPAAKPPDRLFAADASAKGCCSVAATWPRPALCRPVAVARGPPAGRAQWPGPGRGGRGQ